MVNHLLRVCLSVFPNNIGGNVIETVYGNSKKIWMR